MALLRQPAAAMTSTLAPDPAGRPLGQLGPLLCWAVVFADVGSSIYYVPGILRDQPDVGGRAAIFVTAVAVICMFLGFKYAEIAARYPGGGGVVTVAARAFGPFVGCLGGILISTDFFLTASVGAMSGFRYLGSVWDLQGMSLPLACSTLILLGGLNVLGVRKSAMVSLVMAIAGFGTQLIVVLVTVSQLTPGDWTLMRSAMSGVKDLSSWTLLSGFGTAWLAFSGLESLGQIGGALRRPRGRVALLGMAAVFATVLVTAPLLTAFSTTILTSRAALMPRSDRLISELAGVFGGLPLKVTVVLSAAALLVFSANTAILGAYHVFLALTRQGFMPAVFAARSRRFGTPHVAITFATMVPVLILLMTGGQIDRLAELYAFGLLGAFTLASAGLDCVRWREGQRGLAFWLGVLTTGLVIVAWMVTMCAKPLATIFGGSLTVAGMLLAVAMTGGWFGGISWSFFLQSTLLRAGRLLTSVVDGYNRRLSLDTNDRARIHRAVARRRCRRMRGAQAIAAYEAALRLNPRDLEAQLELARLLDEQSMFDQAAEAYRGALAIQPASPETHYRLGLTLLKQGSGAEALACMTRAIELDPRHADAHYRAGLLLGQQGETEAAIAALTRAIAIAPDRARFHRHLALMYQGSGRDADALACFKMALEIESRRVD